MWKGWLQLFMSKFHVHAKEGISAGECKDTPCRRIPPFLEGMRAILAQGKELCVMWNSQLFSGKKNLTLSVSDG